MGRGQVIRIFGKFPFLKKIIMALTACVKPIVGCFCVLFIFMSLCESPTPPPGSPRQFAVGGSGEFKLGWAGRAVVVVVGGRGFGLKYAGGIRLINQTSALKMILGIGAKMVGEDASRSKLRVPGKARLRLRCACASQRDARRRW